MKKLIGTSLALLGVLALGQIAEACTATGVYDRATRVEDTEIYDTVRGVIETDTVIQQEDWQNPDATHAAVGTVLREAYIRDRGVYVGSTNEYETYENHLNTPGKVRQMLNDGTGYVSPNGTPYSGHTTVSTVRDHAIMHGNNWEDGTGGANPVTNPTTTPPTTPPTPIDHAG